MPKNLNVSNLLDVYGKLLTGNQTEVLNLYFNEDLSLSEISEIMDISRQGASDIIHRGEEKLNKLEQKLGFYGKIKNITRAEQILQSIISSNCSNAVKEEVSKALKLLE